MTGSTKTLDTTRSYRAALARDLHMERGVTTGLGIHLEARAKDTILGTLANVVNVHAQNLHLFRAAHFIP